MKLSKPLFISIEGCEFIGKSTLADELAKKLSYHQEIIRTYEPGGTELADDIRSLFGKTYHHETICAETELMLVTAARIQHVHNVISPALRANKTIVCDRYVDSTRVYQGIKLDEDYIEKFLSPVKIPYPDVTLLLICDIDTIKKRMEENLRQKKDRFDELFGMQDQIQKRFLRLAKQYPRRIKIVDTSESEPREVLEYVLKILPLEVQ